MCGYCSNCGDKLDNHVDSVILGLCWMCAEDD